MTDDTADSLRDIALAVTEDGTVTETQEEGPSHDPVDAETARIAEEASAASEDGLDEAVDADDGAIAG